MNLFKYNRSDLSFVDIIYKTPGFLMFFAKSLFIIKQPLHFIRAYILAEPVTNNLVEFRNGLKIFLSDNPEDVITVFLIFIKEDYGDVEENSSVIDIGANIGAFALYCVTKKAKKVLSFEPCAESYQILLKNIKENNLENKIEANYLAVTSADKSEVSFPKKSNPNNRLSDQNEETEIVKTTNLENIFNKDKKINLLKMDCEGGEYDILFNSNIDELKNLDEIKLEYHNGKTDEIDSSFKKLGFQKVEHRVVDISTGYLNYKNYNKREIL